MNQCEKILQVLRGIQVDLISLSRIEAVFGEDERDEAHDLCQDIKDNLDDILDMADKTANEIDDDE